MTKSHPLHRKKAIHMIYRHSGRVRRLFWRLTAVFERVERDQREKVIK